METVRLGRTNLIAKKLGWGGIPIQRVDESGGVSVIRRVIELGVDLLDTARGYTNSEARIGLALQSAKKPVILSSKSMIKTEKVYDDVHISLRQMKVKKIDIYHMHSVNSLEDYEKVMGPGGAYEGLKRSQKEGWIDYIGLTSHSLDVLEKVLKDGYVDVIMACYSFLEPEAAQKIFPLAKVKDIGVLTMKPFSGGVIEDAGPALRFVLSTPHILPIPGSETLEKVEENWEIFTRGGSLTRSDQEKIETYRKEFARQFCRRCDYCQPCSEKISIQLILGLKSLIKRFGLPTEELPWLKSLIEKSRSCSECGECLPRCPYQLPIPELIKKNLDWYDRLVGVEGGDRA